MNQLLKKDFEPKILVEKFHLNPYSSDNQSYQKLILELIWLPLPVMVDFSWLSEE